MKKEAAKDLLYGGLLEIMQTREFYYNSGMRGSYSYFTDIGKEAVAEYLDAMANIMLASADAYIDQQSKDLIMKGLTTK